MKISNKAPLRLAAHKASIQEAPKPPLQRNIEKLKKLNDCCFASEDYKEGINAFMEKRKPEFKGK